MPAPPIRFCLRRRTALLVVVLALPAGAGAAEMRAGRAAAPGASAAAPAPPASSLASIGERIVERMHAHAQRAKAADERRGENAKSTARALDKGGPPGERPAALGYVNGHWSYGGDAGPRAWGRLKPEFVACAHGRRQSPIDIQGGIKVQLEPVAFDYRPGPFRVIDTGHTVQVEVAPGSAIEVMGRRFELVQFHFHRPSEERVDGRTYDMVVHLVHKDPEGRLAVVAVLLERGSAQPVVQAVWNHLPLEQDDPVAVSAGLDPAGLLPEERGYYTYMGSLTTPPCSEGVLWMVMKKPVTVSETQIGIFARLYPMNARPIQAASGRLIKESE
jgi:carbonic anhydrase